MSRARRRGLVGVLVAVGVLAAVLVLFEATSIDQALQDRFYDAATGRWWIDWESRLGRALGYHGPKGLVIAIGLATLALALGPAAWRRRFALDRRGLFAAVLTLATVPLLAGLGKRLLDVHCPYDLSRYGGEETYVRLCACRGPEEPETRRGGCFPAGHASGGFALLGLAAARDDRRWRRLALALGLGIGGWMGAYQMLRGAHFLSHTVTTLLLAWILARSWEWALAGARAAPGDVER
jgi:membrane-associated PAP2 superfamily phosphatase